jgi:DeoR/GlpR family transcriptional regulator of sugar metabolism
MATPEERRNFILRSLEEGESVAVGDLAETLGVSPMTVRRDLAELERGGMVRRVHGGAIPARGRSYEPPYPLRSAQASRAKEAIGAAAARLVAGGDTVALDIGTTTWQVANHLLNRGHLTIVTPSVHIANLFLFEPDVRLILAGGIMRPGEGSLIGELTQYAFGRLFVDKLFLGVGCIDATVGLSEYNWDDALTKQAMIRSAKEVIVVADATKFGKVAFAHVARFGEIHKLVTDSLPPIPILAALERARVEVIVAPALAGPAQPGAGPAESFVEEASGASQAPRGQETES